MKGQVRKLQKGFTLIELMIVVAVIGVLSAIAIPQYQKYVAKSQAASALATIAALKTNVETSIADNSAFPTVAATATGDATLGMPSTDLGTVALAATGTDTSGTITYALTSASALINSTNIVLTRSASGDWVCSATVADTSLVPKSCR
ncbi:pilin [Photobacterium aphoticum]|uniref:Fimbrial protein n=1 Tax=Photobacterium aphoticum TaxID=754436 RepID=A0A0J1GSD0_9GAMM|nr:pilin [Photobacterium aphoticum]KLV02653.1 fimbrial protein [Photobacterium aphoticum]PSU56468.1 prepilin-type cleavage/methylation domain-containing protein [Photobacterium aphoticum]GHA54003.1 prepilin-type N-terminal cleavage/methylation domain-containing protein [Photobacterium aphoticum]